MAPRPRFAHGIEVPVDDRRSIVGSFHVSQQNTFTGKLTEPMLDAVFLRAEALAWSLDASSRRRSGFAVSPGGTSREDGVPRSGARSMQSEARAVSSAAAYTTRGDGEEGGDGDA